MTLSPNPLIGHKSALQVAASRAFAGAWDWLTCSTATLGGGELQVLHERVHDVGPRIRLAYTIAASPRVL
jgi:hypothetical protein